MSQTRPMILALLSALGACEVAGPADYAPSAVVEGEVVDGEGHGFPGLTIEVWVLKDDCTEEPTSTASDPEPVVTGAGGEFTGTFETLAAGPISVACVIVRALDGEGEVVAEALVEERTEWRSPPLDTVVVRLAS